MSIQTISNSSPEVDKISTLRRLLDMLEDGRIPLNDTLAGTLRFAREIDDQVLEGWIELETSRLDDPMNLRRYPQEIQRKAWKLFILSRSLPTGTTKRLREFLADPKEVKRALDDDSELVIAEPIGELEARLSVIKEVGPTSVADYYRQQTYSRVRNRVHGYLLDIYQDEIRRLNKKQARRKLGFDLPT